MRKYKQGKFSPKNPKKYKGDPTNIIYRSGWEKKVMQDLDENANVLEWGSEEIVVPYRSPVDGRLHRYFPDFIVKAKQRDGSIVTYMLEIKPHAQTKPPRRSKKKDPRQYITEVATYGVNQAKFEAAKEFCSHRGWVFRVITERHLKV